MKNKSSRILLVLFLFVNGLVLTNAIFHEPSVQYDGLQHLRYIESLAQFHLPESSDTREYFSPPLPYVFPALLLSTGHFTLWNTAKMGQFLNVLLSVGLTLTLLKICEHVRPGSWSLKIATFCLLGVQTVYYKMFAFVRGEPWVAFLAVLSVYLALEIWVQGRRTVGRVAGLGISLGFLALARQWGFLVFPAMITWVVILVLRRPAAWLQILKPLAASLALAALIGAPFYLSLITRYGSFLAFNMAPASRIPSLSNQPPDFYLGLGGKDLFTRPVRPAFPNQFWPIFYSETWGDYWQYFSVYGQDARKNHEDPKRFVSGEPLMTAWFQQPSWLSTNRGWMESYLGRVNVTGLYPSALYIVGLLCGFTALIRLILSTLSRRKRWDRPDSSFASFHMTDVQEDNTQGEARDMVLALATLIVIFSFVGYAVFLICYPILGKGDTIKAGYLLHIFPFLALLSGNFFERIRGHSNLLFVGGLVLLTLITVHNLPAMMTHYISIEKMTSWLSVVIVKTLSSSAAALSLMIRCAISSSPMGKGLWRKELSRHPRICDHGAAICSISA